MAHEIVAGERLFQLGKFERGQTASPPERLVDGEALIGVGHVFEGLAAIHVVQGRDDSGGARLTDMSSGWRRFHHYAADQLRYQFLKSLNWLSA